LADLLNVDQYGNNNGAGGHGHGHLHFKVVLNKWNSLLATDGHPAGWVNQTTEKEEKELKGSESGGLMCMCFFFVMVW
jgi:hypothetical protein